MTHRTLGVLLACLLSIALVGCGGTSEPKSDSEPGGNEAEGSYEPLGVDDFADALVAAMEPYETVHGEGSFVGSSMSMDVRMSESDPAVALTLTGAQGFDMTILDETVYMRDAGQELYDQLPAEQADSVLGEIGEMTPEGSVAKLRAGLEAVEYAGVEDVDGQPLHRYDVTMSRQALAEEAEVPIDQIPDVTFRFWVDGDHLLQRAEVDLPGDSGDSDFVYSDWGEPVKIEPPAAEQIR